MNFRNLNPNDFKKWMKQHDDDDERSSAKDVVGMAVEARHCGKRTARSIVLETGKAGRVVREFIQNGGTIKSVDGDEYLIEVASGSFYINKRDVNV